ncbi:unnamed protein product [Schistosoma margrebowiei]|uniref:Uncharacterized protein n=1 Tax=Schistosoma margrebowiei TaxID=48269 RepID=A0A183LZ05_9TREM|nr:unnamed protein product [Schistosoma margrebowiei]
MVVGGSQQETLDPGFVLLGTRQQGVLSIEISRPDRKNQQSTNSTRFIEGNSYFPLKIINNSSIVINVNKRVININMS